MDFFQKERIKRDIRMSIARQNKILQNDASKTQVKTPRAEEDLMEQLPTRLKTLQNNDGLQPSPPKKTVRIHSRVWVRLIPSREEYRAAQLQNALWWAPDDQTRCTEEAVEEIRNFQKKSAKEQKPVSAREAMNALYQPPRY